ncbi:hypothetical protein ACIOHE_21905 [Streptomyces sp. NPDC087851]|uniref:hypothetical protein n=1 Tax=Streptomyces sp. NPDC087851 TaxID=3365810 RepID=UPI0038131058
MTATSCTTEKSAPPPDHPCGTDEEAGTRALLQQIMGTDKYITTIHNTNSKLMEKMTEELQKMRPSESAMSFSTCLFRPKDSQDGGKAFGIEYTWTAREDSTKGRLPYKVSYYNINGALGEANDVSMRLRVPCDLPGNLRKASSQAFLLAESSNTLDMKDASNQKTRDQQATFLYLMTRKATDAIGCNNNPLEKDPTVKAFSTPEEATRVGS